MIRNRSNVRMALAASSALAAMGLGGAANAADVYWDLNGTTAGASAGTTAAGTWDTTANNWNLDPGGIGTGTQAYVAGDNVFFSAGTNATGAFNINPTAGLAPGHVTIQEGTIRPQFPGFPMGTAGMTILSGATVEIDNITRVPFAAGAAPTLLDGGRINQTNPGNAGAMWSALSTLSIGANGGTLSYTSSSTGTSALYGSATVGQEMIARIIRDPSVPDGQFATLTKSGVNEVRYQGVGLPNTTYDKLKVTQGLFRLGFLGSVQDERGFGAVPASFMADQITLSGGGMIGVSFGATLHANRGITLGAGGGGIFGVSGASLAVPGVITGSGSLFSEMGGQLLTLSGANNYTGGFSQISGTTTVTSTGSLAGAASAVSTTAGTLNLNNAAQTIAGLSGTGGTVNLTAGHALTVNQAGASNFGGNLNGGTATLNKQGVGNLTLSGATANTIGGLTTVSGGTLTLNKTAGVNAVGGNVTATGGVVALGASDQIGDGAALVINGASAGMAMGANSETVNSVELNGGGSITGTGTLTTATTFEVKSGSASAVLAGAGKALNKTTAGTVDLTGGNVTTFHSNTYTGGTNVSDGKLIVNRLHGLAADATGTPNPVSITAGTLQVRESSPTIASGHPGGNNAFVSRPGSMITIANNGGDIVSLNPTTLTPRIYDGTLDLTNNDLVIDYDGASPIADVEDMIRAGRNGGGWNGKGIISSTAGSIAAAGAYTLGVIDNATPGITPFTTFSGQTVDTTTVLVKFVHRSDINMDGVVTFSDSVRFNGNYSEGTPTRWVFGDLNYNGVSDFGDSVLFNGGYDEALSSLPEPGGLAILGMAWISGFARRNRARSR